MTTPEQSRTAGPPSPVPPDLLDMLSRLVLEVACTRCASHAFALPPDIRLSVLECPVCGSRTIVSRDGERMNVVSEERLARIANHLRAKRWFCQEHQGVPVEISGIEQDIANPLMVTLHYVCRRSSSWRKKRSHAGTRKIHLLAYEAEMLAGTKP